MRTMLSPVSGKWEMCSEVILQSLKKRAKLVFCFKRSAPILDFYCKSRVYPPVELMPLLSIILSSPVTRCVFGPSPYFSSELSEMFPGPSGINPRKWQILRSNYRRLEMPFVQLLKQWRDTFVKKKQCSVRQKSV